MKTTYYVTITEYCKRPLDLEYTSWEQTIQRYLIFCGTLALNLFFTLKYY